MTDQTADLTRDRNAVNAARNATLLVFTINGFAFADLVAGSYSVRAVVDDDVVTAEAELAPGASESVSLFLPFRDSGPVRIMASLTSPVTRAAKHRWHTRPAESGATRRSPRASFHPSARLRSGREPRASRHHTFRGRTRKRSR